MEEWTDKHSFNRVTCSYIVDIRNGDIAASDGRSSFTRLVSGVEFDDDGLIAIKRREVVVEERRRSVVALKSIGIVVVVVASAKGLTTIGRSVDVVIFS